MHTTIRAAHLDDAAFLVSGNASMARETESLALDPDVLHQGVVAALVDPAKARYFVAEVPHDGKPEPVGMLMITLEWSDWRNGQIWWIQSVYVRPEFRRQGVFRALYRHAREQAAAAGAAGLRLYVEKANATAQATYTSLGMHVTPYLVMEEMLRKGAAT